MTDETAPAGAGWFEGVSRDDRDAAAAAIRDGEAAAPKSWPTRAVADGYVESTDDYYGWLHEATLDATRRAVRERERADDQQLTHAVRAIDDRGRIL
jgi:nucleolar protein 56